MAPVRRPGGRPKKQKQPPITQKTDPHLEPMMVIEYTLVIDWTISLVHLSSFRFLLLLVRVRVRFRFRVRTRDKASQDLEGRRGGELGIGRDLGLGLGIVRVWVNYISHNII